MNGLEGTGQGPVAEGVWESDPHHPYSDTLGASGCLLLALR